MPRLASVCEVEAFNCASVNSAESFFLPSLSSGLAAGLALATFSGATALATTAGLASVVLVFSVATAFTGLATSLTALAAALLASALAGVTDLLVGAALAA